MNKLPVLVSVPHAGLNVPEEVSKNCLLSKQEIVANSDEHAREIYNIADEVDSFVCTDIAKAIVDLNRPTQDLSTDGVVKTHTSYAISIYRTPLLKKDIHSLLRQYYWPYHTQLTRLATRNLVLAIDCHTMASVGPPLARDSGVTRPRVCLSNGDGTLPGEWFKSLFQSFKLIFGESVTMNEPFKGGHIIRAHASEMPWVQLELSKDPFMPVEEKRTCVLMAIQQWFENHRRP